VTRVESRHRDILILLLLIALTVRLGWALTRPTDVESMAALPDQNEYLEVARSFLSGEGFSFVDPRFEQRVFAYRTPGYPLLLVGAGANITVARILQSLIDTSTVLAAFLLTRRWLPPSAGLLAAAFVAFNPYLIYFSGLLLTETLFTAMLAWGMVLLTSARTRFWVAGAILLTLSILVRPGAIALPIALAVLAEMTNRSDGPAYHRRWPLPVGATMLLLLGAVLLPWGMRNHRAVGAWVWTSTNAGITRYDGFNPNATGASDQSFVQSMPQLQRMSETERDAYLADLAQQFIRSNPAQSLHLAIEKIARTWSPRPLSSEFSRPTYVAAALLYTIPFDVLILIGVLRGSLSWPVKLFLAAPAVYLTAAAAFSVGSLRYRIPAEVPMAVVAAAGACWALSGSKSSNNDDVMTAQDSSADVA
jgi:4-amino-4-deoxy-L-arabinose transferase-like glycosyltransferase